jgi:hypothetical protein
LSALGCWASESRNGVKIKEKLSNQWILFMMDSQRRVGMAGKEKRLGLFHTSDWQLGMENSVDNV